MRIYGEERRGDFELNFVVSRCNTKEINTMCTANISKINDVFKSTNFENNLALLWCKVDKNLLNFLKKYGLQITE